MVAECVRGLNALYSGDKFGKANSQCQTPSRAQLAALEHIRNSVHLLGAPEQELSGREALWQLQAFDGYGEDQAPPLVASYEPSLLSLPTGEVPPVPLHTLLGGDGMKIVEDFISTRLLQKNEALRNLRRTGVVKCYSDPRLLEARVYKSFVRRLWDGGLVEFTSEEPTEKVEVFFVRKKDGRLRMVVDCRRSNEWFAPPDKVNLATAEVLSRIDLGGTDCDLYISTADLKDAFYHFELPLQLRPYFGMRPLSAGDLGITSLGGKAIRASSLVFPRLKVLPMGWTHALWWCQNIHQRIVSGVGATADKCLEDRASVPSPECMHLEYVDNFVCIGTAKEEVEALAAAGVQALRDKGLVVHEVASGEGNIKVLGWCFQGKKLRPLSHRVWRLIAAIRFLLDRGTCSGKQLEKVLGHATFIALGRREALAVFGESYSFVRTHYEQNHRIWPSVRRELMIWTSIAPLLWRDLGIPWASEVAAVDASTWGLGAVVADFDEAEVRQLGKYSERWRFEIPEFRCPRASAFGTAFADDSDEARSLQWAHSGDNNAKARPVPLSVVEGKLLSDRFVPVASSQVDRKWRVVGRHKWKRQEGMPVLEGRASLFAVKRLLRKETSFHMRHLILSDSTAAICALDRGRGRSFGMRRVTQQLASLCLCSGISVQFRFIPSEWNPADAVSRGSLFPSSAVHGGAQVHPAPQSCSQDRTAAAGQPCEPARGPKPAAGQEDSREGQGQNQAAIRDVGGGISEPWMQRAVQQAVEEDVHSGGVNHDREVHRERPRPPGEPSFGGLVRRGGGFEPGPVPHCGDPVLPAPSPWWPRRVGPGKANSRRVATTGPAKVEAAVTLGSRVLDGYGSHHSQHDRGGPLYITRLCDLPETGRGSQTAGGWLGAPRWGGQSMVADPSPAGARNAFEDGGVRRDSVVRPSSDCVDRRADLPSAQGRPPMRLGAAVLGEPRDSEKLHARCRKPVRHGSCSGRSASLSSSSWRSEPGCSAWLSNLAGNPKTGEVAQFQQCAKVRERWSRHTADASPLQGDAAKGAGGKPKHPVRGVWPALNVPLGPAVRVYIEIFSGRGELGKALAQQCGGVVMLWDLRLGSQYDLRHPARRAMICGWIRAGRISGVHLGTPCESFTRARDAPPGPCPLRSNLQPLGLRGLCPADQVKVELGNLWMRFSVKVVLLCWKLRLSATLENPLTSRFWRCPPVQQLLRRPHVGRWTTHYCAWGKPFKKPTAFLGVHIDLSVLELHKCRGKRICDFTLRPHVPLQGRTAAGQWRTKWAEPYPTRMCAAIAKAFYNAEVAVLARKFEQCYARS